MKHTVIAKIERLTAQAEAITAADMVNEFRQVLIQQFKLRKDIMEDWQNLTETEEAKLSNRLRVIADKSDWSDNNLKDMALICAMLWNNK